MIKIDDMKNINLFYSLPDEALASIGARADIRSFERNEQILLEGSPCRSLNIVRSGRIKVFKTSQEGREHIFYYADIGETFCEPGIFDEGPSPLAATAVTDGAMIVIGKNSIKSLISKVPGFAEALLKNHSIRIRRLVEMVEGLSFKNVPGRIAGILVEMAGKEGVEKGGNILLERTITLYEMASMAGTVREVVTRSLQELERKGYLNVSRHQIEITDLESLKKL